MSAVTACSGGDDAAPTTTVSSTVAATTTEATTTTAAPTTPPPTTTAPTPTTAPPTAPPTTPAPVSTAPLDPIADLAAALQRDAQAAEATLFQVLADPFAVDAEDRLRAVFAATRSMPRSTTLGNFRRDNLIVVANPEVPAAIYITGPATLIDGSDPLRATAETCRLDSAIVMATVNDTDVRVPINDVIYRTDAVSTFVLEDGRWLLEGGDTVSTSEGDQACD